ncbi:MAG: DUF4250 domain-containing protein [Clostridiales bacterium]|nr:DUF4250 domain-containing protein [Clostridiales bacterium]
MSLPKDDYMLLSVVNTKLRDFYPSLDSLCADIGESRAAVTGRLAKIGYKYDEKSNQFC